MAGIAVDRLWLVVGVTGHRDVDPGDVAALRDAFGALLDQFARRHRHTPPLVLSGLAPGADTLAAEEALARGVPVVACLPMPVEEYERDFSADELPRFRALLGRCARTFVTSPARDGGYLAAGLFIAQYSHVLVAFWDGEDGRGAGGTADVVRLRLVGDSRDPAEATEIPYLPDLGPVYHVVTPRAGEQRPARSLSTVLKNPQRFAGDDTFGSDFATMLDRIDRYNGDLSTVRGSPEDRGALQSLLDRTDRTANVLQKRTNFFRNVLFGVAFVAAAGQISPHLPIYWKIATLLAALIAYAVARLNDYDNRYQDYRAVAEGLRVQIAWQAAGERRAVERSYLQMQESELQWIRMALRTFYLLCCEGRADPNATNRSAGCRAWIDSQIAYYRKGAKRHTRLKRTLGRISLAVAAAGVACAIASALLLLPLYVRGFASWGPPAPSLRALLAQTLTEPLSLALVFWAIVEHYVEEQDLAPYARRYERMVHIFEKARNRLHEIDGGAPGDGATVVLSLGESALAEHANWLMTRRERPLRIVS